MDTVEVLVRRQSELWRDTISGAHNHWQQLSTSASEAAMVGVRQAISEALDEHRQKLREDVERLTSLQSEGAAQIDGRLQQWQTTISEQARVSLRHQQELNRQTETLERLLETSQLVAAMQAPMAASLERLSDMERFHEAAVSLSEAITVLGAHVEQIAHAGPTGQRRAVLRRRNDSPGNVLAPEGEDAKALQATSSPSNSDPEHRDQDERLEYESESPTISIPIAPHTAANSVFRTHPSATSSRTRRAG
jgi:chromosome segregation ATPase